MQQSLKNKAEDADNVEETTSPERLYRAQHPHDYSPSPEGSAMSASLHDRIADAITSFSGRMIFAYVHIVWFGVWILLNTGKFRPAAF